MIALESLFARLDAYLARPERERMQQALDLAQEIFATHTRQSGGSFLEHAVAVADILAGWRAPFEILAAGLFHDVTGLPGEQAQAVERVRQGFGAGVAGLVEEVKVVSTFVPPYPGANFEDFAEHEDDINRIPWEGRLLVRQPEAAVIKIADRLESFSSLENLAPERQERFSVATMNVFIPLANSLGMGEAQRQLEDYAFRSLRREEYERTRAAYPPAQAAGEMAPLMEDLARALDCEHLVARLGPAPASLFEIYRRQLGLQRKQKMPAPPQRELVYALLVVCERPVDCYRALGILHETWPPLSSGELRDHLNRPYENGYRALHTRLALADGRLLRVILCDRQGDLVARWGITAAWRDVPARLLPRLPQVRQPGAGSPTPEVTRITVFTPRGRPIGLPVNATPLDFAYELHTDIGNQCVAARIHGRPAALDAPLRNGDVVEILTSSAPIARPPALVQAVRTRKARHALGQKPQAEDELPLRASLVLQAQYRAAALRALSLASARLGDGLEKAELRRQAGQPFGVEMRLRSTSKKLEQVCLSLRKVPGVVQVSWQPEAEPAPAEVPAAPLALPGNPHTLLPVTGPQFVGREQDLDELIRSLGELRPGESVLVWGQRRIGKTSLLKEFVRRYLSGNPSFLPVFIDMQGVGGKTTLDFLRYVAGRISQASGTQVPPPTEAGLQDDPLEAFTAFLGALWAVEKRRLVLLLDEFELLADLADERIPREDLFRYLRGAIQERSEINIILSGGGMLSDLQKIGGLSPLLNVVRWKKVGFLSMQGARRLVCISGSSVTYDEAVVERLLELTACHPYYIQLLCGELVGQCKDRRVTPAALDALLDDWLPGQPETFFDHLWGANIATRPFMLPVYRHLLVAITGLKSEDGWLTLAELDGRRKREPAFLHLDTEMALHDLVEMETLQEEGGAYRIRIPLLGRWLAENFSLVRSAKEITRWKPPS